MRSLSILVLLALSTAAFASGPGYGTAVDRLLAASPATVAVRRVDARRPVEVVLGLPWRDERELASLVRDLADPQSPRFGRYLSAQESTGASPRSPRASMPSSRSCRDRGSR